MGIRKIAMIVGGAGLFVGGAALMFASGPVLLPVFAVSGIAAPSALGLGTIGTAISGIFGSTAIPAASYSQVAACSAIVMAKLSAASVTVVGVGCATEGATLAVKAVRETDKPAETFGAGCPDSSFKYRT